MSLEQGAGMLGMVSDDRLSACLFERNNLHTRRVDTLDATDVSAAAWVSKEKILCVG